ncbi:MAG: protein-export chaperone SecB [Chromatiales bacterium]|nr:protein-export chaperone SecB [Chromatiales bacterium]
MIEVKSIYIKDASFESPHTPKILDLQWNPNVDIDMHSINGKIEEADNLYESILQITVTAKHEETTIFMVEVEQAGVFQISELSGEELNKALQVDCPNILFPYAREAISSIVSRGGFPQLLLAPINFKSIYLQKNYAKKERMTGKPH